VKKLNIILLLSLSLFLIACGSSERGVAGSSNTTSVSLNIAQPVSASSNSGSIGVLASQRPSYVETVQVVVTDHDSGDVLVDTTVNVAGQSSVTLTLNVPNGDCRLFMVYAYDNDSVPNLVYSGSASADLNGTSVVLPIDVYYYY